MGTEPAPASVIPVIRVVDTAADGTLLACVYRVHILNGYACKPCLMYNPPLIFQKNNSAIIRMREQCHPCTDTLLVKSLQAPLDPLHKDQMSLQKTRSGLSGHMY